MAGSRRRQLDVIEMGQWDAVREPADSSIAHIPRHHRDFPSMLPLVQSDDPTDLE
ncbi:MAG: hypothetical protein HY700_17070 [Gemmatimonadetes bacterium]|nr:hypothetical protein [Gemmatimonadota bacterium]